MTMSSAASRQTAASSKSASELGGEARVASDRVRRGAKVLLREQVRVDVVVDDRAVLVRAGDAVDAEATLRIVMAERPPQARRLDEQLDADLAIERVVLRRRVVARDRVGDGRADVEGGRARRPVAGALLPADRAPREGGALEPELRRPLTGERRESNGASGARRAAASGAV